MHPLLGSALFRSEHVHLVVGLHTKRLHVLFGVRIGQSGQNGDALRQADDLLVQLPGFLVGGAPGASGGPAPTRMRVKELEPGDAILAGGVEHEPVLLPFLMD